MDLFERIEQHATRHADEVALQTVSEDATDFVTFRQLLDRARALSGLIRSAGCEDGSRVALLMPNDHRFGIAFLAAASAGVVVVPLDTSQDSTRLAATIANAECSLLLSIGFPEQLLDIRKRLPELPVLDPTLRRSEVLPGWPLSRRDPDSDFLLMYTGGTTGAPKAVRLSMRNIVVTIRDTLDVFPLTAADHILSILPMFHIMAIQANLLGPLYAGARVTYLQSRDPQRVVDAFREFGITAFLCVPLFYYQLHRRIFSEVARQGLAKRKIFKALVAVSRFFRKTAGWNLGRVFFGPIHKRFGRRLRGFGVGAARFSPEIAADLHDLGFAFFQGYGMTETGGLAAISAMSLKGGLTSGHPLKNVEIRLDAPDPQGRGEILLRGENIMKGYWKDPEATRATLVDGWLRTGDVGQISDTHEISILGRSKEVIVLSSGKNIFPEPLEIFFQSNCPLIQEICVFGFSEDGAAGERLHAVLVPDAAKLREQSIVNVRQEIRYHIDNLNQRLPAHEKLSGFDIRFEPLPRTSSRKLQRFRIQEEFARIANGPRAEEIAPEADAASSFPLIRDMIARIKPGRTIRPEMNLELDLAFDSLERVELLSNIQDVFGLRMNSEQTSRIFTVADLIDLSKDVEPVPTEWASWHDILREPLSDTEQAMADRYLSPRPAAAPLLFLGTKTFCFMAKILLRYRSRAPHGFPPDGPLIVYANHQSFLDFPLMVGALPYSVFRRTFSLSTSTLLQSRFQIWFGRQARSIPVDPDRNLRSALRLAAEGLRRGMVLCVFPEGHRSIDGQLQPFRKGTAIVAVESGVPAIPVGVTGTGDVWGRGHKKIRLAPVSVEFGAATRPSAGENYDAFNERLQAAVLRLIGGLIRAPR